MHVALVRAAAALAHARGAEAQAAAAVLPGAGFHSSAGASLAAFEAALHWPQHMPQDSAGPSAVRQGAEAASCCQAMTPCRGMKYIIGIHICRVADHPALLLQHVRGAASAMLRQQEQLAAAWGQSAQDRAALAGSLTRLMVRIPAALPFLSLQPIQKQSQHPSCQQCIRAPLGHKAHPEQVHGVLGGGRCSPARGCRGCTAGAD